MFHISCVTHMCGHIIQHIKMVQHGPRSLYPHISSRQLWFECRFVFDKAISCRTYLIPLLGVISGRASSSSNYFLKSPIVTVRFIISKALQCRGVTALIYPGQRDWSCNLFCLCCFPMSSFVKLRIFYVFSFNLSLSFQHKVFCNQVHWLHIIFIVIYVFDFKDWL